MDEMKQLPLISVIIPAYNAEKTLMRACRSVLAQSYPNMELVIVNDGSTDGTADEMAVAAKLGHNVKLLQKENGGVSSARNKGLDSAAGEYLYFLDADDEIPEDTVTKLYTLLTEHRCDIAAGHSQKIKPDGTVVEKPYEMEGTALLWDGQQALENSLKDHPATYSSCGKLYSRECIGSVRFREDLRIHEDSFFLFTVFQKPVKMVVANECTVRVHLTENSASRSGFSEKYLDILSSAQKKQEIVEQNHPQLLPLAKNVRVKACLALLKVMRRGCGSRFIPVEKECLRIVRQDSRYFIPATTNDKRMFWIVRLRLYSLIKFLTKIRKQLGM